MQSVRTQHKATTCNAPLLQPSRPISTCYAVIVWRTSSFISMTMLEPHSLQPCTHLRSCTILWSPRAECLQWPRQPPSPSCWQASEQTSTEGSSISLLPGHASDTFSVFYWEHDLKMEPESLSRCFGSKTQFYAFKPLSDHWSSDVKYMF